MTAKKCSHSLYSINVRERYAPGKIVPCGDDHLGDVLHLEDPLGVALHLVVHPREDHRSEDPQREDPHRGGGLHQEEDHLCEEGPHLEADRRPEEGLHQEEEGLHRVRTDRQQTVGSLSLVPAPPVAKQDLRPLVLPPGRRSKDATSNADHPAPAHLQHKVSKRNIYVVKTLNFALALFIWSFVIRQ